MTTKTGKDKALEQMQAAYEQAAIESTETPTPSALTTFKARPAVVLTLQSFNTSFNGLQAVWQFESENKFGQSVALWLIDIFKAVVLPLLSLLWLALTTAYQIARKPETRAAFIARYESLKGWLAPKFGYERDEQLSFDTND
jgi:hypothetical protein